jgi:hypothetical protein
VTSNDVTLNLRKAHPMRYPITDEQAIRLAAHALDTHELNSSSLEPTPGVDCWRWCHSCKTLDGLPSDLLDAAAAYLAAAQAELAAAVSESIWAGMGLTR